MTEIKEKDGKVLLIVDGKEFDMGQAQTTGISKDLAILFAKDMIDRGFKNKGEYALHLMKEGYNSVHSLSRDNVSLLEEIKKINQRLDEHEEKLFEILEDDMNSICRTLNTIDYFFDDKEENIQMAKEYFDSLHRQLDSSIHWIKKQLIFDDHRLMKTIYEIDVLLRALCARDRHIDLKAILEEAKNIPDSLSIEEIKKYEY